MDLEKVADFAKKHVSLYLSEFSDILVRPGWKYAPRPASIPPEGGEEAGQIDANVLFFVLRSLFISFVIYGAIPDLHPAKSGVASYMVTAFLIVASWYLFAQVVYRICCYLRGVGDYGRTVAAAMQVLSVVYVSSNYITFLLDNLLISMNFIFFYKYPFIIYNITWAFMFGYYLQKAVGDLYVLGRLERLSLVLIALSFVLVGMILVMPIGASSSLLAFLGGNPRRFPRVD